MSFKSSSDLNVSSSIRFCVVNESFFEVKARPAACLKVGHNNNINSTASKFQDAFFELGICKHFFCIIDRIFSE